MERAAQVSEAGDRGMRPSDLKSAAHQLPPERALKFPVDPRAEPPISVEEALAAGGANCPRHHGLVGQRGDKAGIVFLCMGCRMYWRYWPRDAASRRPLMYPRRAYI
jgi:hypothetical protein